MPTFPDGVIDIILTDPPYGTTQNKWDSVIPFEPMWEQSERVCKKSAVFVFTASQPFSSALVMSRPMLFKHEWVWIKNRGSNFANTVREPMKEHEQVLVFSKGKWTYNKQMQERTGSGADRVNYEFTTKTKTTCYGEIGAPAPKQGELRVPSSWQKFNTAAGSEKTKHATQKPIALMEYLIKTYTNENDIVLDFAAGSFTTGVACLNLNRRFIGIEKEEEYYQLGIERLTKAIEQAA